MTGSRSGLRGWLGRVMVFCERIRRQAGLRLRNYIAILASESSISIPMPDAVFPPNNVVELLPEEPGKGHPPGEKRSQKRSRSLQRAPNSPACSMLCFGMTEQQRWADSGR